MEASQKTKAYGNTKTISRLLLTNYFSMAGEKGIFEVGPVSQMISYNKMEGLRMKLGGNTTLNLNKHLLLGGYVAYGTKDEEWKYRGDIIYSFKAKDRDIWEYPKRLLSLSYVHDLNIPGEDILTTNRDFFLYSFSHIPTRNLSMQKLAAISYEHELSNHFSFRIGGKYLNDRPAGDQMYYKKQNDHLQRVEDITSGELNFGLRYAPGEAFLQIREDRKNFRKANVELNFQHRIGIKNFFDSDYSYHITEISAYKGLNLPENIGKFNIELSARKVWDRLPFPFLLISGGNQSYVFKENDYNLMDYSEFITDNYIAGKMNLQFNWSPLSLFYKSKIKTNLGTKVIYGPLSDKNNPDYHPELFVFNGDMKPLGDRPYVEMNVGLSNVLRFFRIEWVQRFTYLDHYASGKKKHKGSIFFSASFAL